MNKTLYLKSALLLVCLACSISFGFSKGIYLSSVGNDANSGLETDAPLATLTKAFDLAADGDVINVSGVIDVSVEALATSGVVLPSKRLVIDGSDKTLSGFDAKLASRILYIDANVKGCIFRNLSFTNGGGSGIYLGTAVYCKSSDTRFENCVFSGNTAVAGDSYGTVYLSNSQGVVLESCTLKNNKVKFGGGVCLDGRGSASILNSVIEKNDLSAITASLGGALYISNCDNLLVKNTIIRGNSANYKGGGIYLTESADAVNLTSVIRFEQCLVAENVAKRYTGGGFIMTNSTEGNTMKISFINTTFWKNATLNAQDGGGLEFFSAIAGSTLDMINCTVLENTTKGAAESGAGIRFWSVNAVTSTQNMLKRIYNCIIESNEANNLSPAASDISFRYEPVNQVDFFLANSFVGKILQVSTTAYIPLGTNRNFTGYNRNKMAGLALPTEEYINSQNSVPLCETAAAARAGISTPLSNLGITVDQLGDIREFKNGRCAAGAIEKTVPIVRTGEVVPYQHIFMYGQSLSTGHQSYPVISTTNVEGNYMLGDQIWINYGNTNASTFNPLVGTIAKSFVNEPFTRSAGTIAECPLFGAVNHIQLKAPQLGRILATSCGTSGTSIEELSLESQTRLYYNQFLNTLIYTAKLARSNNSLLSCPAIYFMQGEYNYGTTDGRGLYPGTNSTTDKNAYKELFIQLKNNMQNAVVDNYNQAKKPLFITYQTGAQYTVGKTLEIGMAQLEASNENGDVVCAGPIYPMTDRGGHLDGNGYRWYGEILGKVFYREKVLGEKFRPLQPRELFRGPASNKVGIRFLVPKLPLVLDERLVEKKANYGFEVYANLIKQRITDIKISNDTVMITCGASLYGQLLEVVYAGSTTSGHGNLRDSDDDPSFYNYLDLDKKNTDNTYVFPRAATETTLRPNYEPKDALGKVIYDQPYPLYNFSVAFYYSIPKLESKYMVPGLDDSSLATPVVKATDGISIEQLGSTLRIETDKELIFSISYFDLKGQMISLGEKEFQSSHTTQYYPLPALSKGIYLAKVNVGNAVRSIKICIK